MYISIYIIQLHGGAREKEWHMCHVLCSISRRSLLITKMYTSSLFASIFILSVRAFGFDLNHFIRNARLNIKPQPTAAAAAALAACINFVNPSPTLAVGIAPLADVGVGTYLVKDGRQLLRLSLPVGPKMLLGSKARLTDSMKAQESLELIRLRLEETGYTNPAAWPAARLDLENTMKIIKTRGEDIFVSTTRSPEVARTIITDELQPKLNNLEIALKERNIEDTQTLQESSASTLAKLRALELPSKALPYEVPSEYASLPRLMGRAKIEMQIKSKNGFRLESGKKYDTDTVVLELDGYHAPLTAGSIMDLVIKKVRHIRMFNALK